MKNSDEKSAGMPEKSLEKSLGSQKPLNPQRSVPQPAAKEIGGPTGLEPTRYGDWERNGRVSDF